MFIAGFIAGIYNYYNMLGIIDYFAIVGGIALGSIVIFGIFGYELFNMFFRKEGKDVK